MIMTMLIYPAVAGEVKLLYGIYPDMREFRLPKPAEFRVLKAEELRVDTERIRGLRPFRPLPAPREAWVRIGEFYRHTPEGRDFWQTFLRTQVLPAVNDWNFPPGYLPMYQARWVKIDPVIDAYFFTGNPWIGKFIHDYTMHAMTLDQSFWMGQTLRDYRKHDGKMRYADLQTLPLARIFNALLTRCRELFTPGEIVRIEEQYREYVLESCNEDLLRRRKWQQPRNNWNAMLASALLLSAKYFDDAPKAEFALEELTGTFLDTIEEDGSYGEGFGYCNYATGALPLVYPYLTAAEREKLFRELPLAKLSRWYLYHDFLNKKQFYRVAFGDDNYFEPLSFSMLYVLAAAYNDPVAALLGASAGKSKPWWNLSVNMHLIGNGKEPAAAPPETLSLPLAAKFANGQAFIRSGWKKEDALFASYLVHPTKVRSHKRGESGNFMFGYNGIPLVMHSGNTNLYRRPIHQLSTSTAAANTVTIDGGEQLGAEKQNTRYTEFIDNDDMTLIRCDLRTAYPVPLKRMERTFAWLKKSGHLVVADRIEAETGEHEFKARLHLNDIFHNTELRREKDGVFLYRHPEAPLWIQTGGQTEVGKGYVVSERFPKWDEAKQQSEADQGNAWRITYGPASRSSKARLWAVLGKEKAVVKANAESLLVNGLQIPY